ncbi:hypothetical protein [Microlunatus parietis]|uniref:DUF4367 domain-containing protein n=1 Tax=Microlunatus parietis TaxID=682979 RepID=A0A7Y9I5R5_9ACTN|nr:hypothetical protein [Microlunatus parietis]NYE70796.1 hypothetical protein [Microlunatus parietis]
MNDQQLETALRDLGGRVRVEPVPEDLAERVLARIPDRKQHPVRRFLRRLVIDVRARRRLIAVIIAALIAGLLLASPVRAAVIEWLRVGGIAFRSAPAPSPSSAGTPARPGGPIMIEVADVEAARTMIDFPIGLPAGLGPPTRVAVSQDRRVVELEFETEQGQVLLSEFDGSMIVFVKRNWERLTKVQVHGELAVWLPESHTISYVDPAGVEHTDAARRSGPSLAFETIPDGTGRTITARIEGDLDQERAVELAESLTFP